MRRKWQRTSGILKRLRSIVSYVFNSFGSSFGKNVLAKKPATVLTIKVPIAAPQVTTEVATEAAIVAFGPRG
jgi:hypothetical protein